jgi:benzoyl-CoA reductase/2-hydroxyglutaryl-CoA dehydratase subunit BcrC/BadD/HgdB
MEASAVDELRAGFEEPFWALGRDPARDGKVVVVSWPSVPIELIRAAGLSPVFARGSSAATPAAKRVLEADLFPNRLRQLVEAALTGRLARVAAIVLPRSSDPDYKCFLYLRELERRGVARALPPVLLFDLLHSDDADARSYNADRTRDLSARLASLAPTKHKREDLGAAIESANRARAAARRLDALRITTPLIAGTDALQLLGAFWQVEPERYASLANAAADMVARRAPLPGPRVLIAGAPVDAPALHAAIEAEGAVVVAELSPFGGVGTSTDIEVSDEAFGALADHYGRESIDARMPVKELMRRLGGALDNVSAVVISLPSDDASFGWDYPRARDLLAARSIPHTVLSCDPALGASPADRKRVASLLVSAHARREASRG